MAVSTCEVSGTIMDTRGVGIQNSGVTIIASVTAPYFYGDGTLISPNQVSTTTDITGNWHLQLIENVSTSTSTNITFLIPDGSGGNLRKDYQIVVPNTATADFATLAAGQ